MERTNVSDELTPNAYIAGWSDPMGPADELMQPVAFDTKDAAILYVLDELKARQETLMAEIDEESLYNDMPQIRDITAAIRTFVDAYVKDEITSAKVNNLVFFVRENAPDLVLRLNARQFGGHTHVDVFIGKQLGQLAWSGSLIMRNEEWPLFDSLVFTGTKALWPSIETHRMHDYDKDTLSESDKNLVARLEAKRHYEIHMEVSREMGLDHANPNLSFDDMGPIKKEMMIRTMDLFLKEYSIQVRLPHVGSI